MIFDQVRDDLISRRVAWEALREMHGITEGVGILKIVGRGFGEMVDRDKVEYMLEELDPAPIQPQHKIEAAIKNLRSILEEKWLKPEDIVDLCRYFLTGEKDQDTWKDRDFGLEEEK